MGLRDKVGPKLKPRPKKLRCADCNLRRFATERQVEMARTAPFVCKACRDRAVTKGQIDPAQAPLPFELDEVRDGR